MKRIAFILFLCLFFTSGVFAQEPVMVVNRVDKYTGERIRQTSLYTLNDVSGKSYLNISIRAVNDEQSLLINVPKPVNIKKGTNIELKFGNGETAELPTGSDIISISASDVNKKLMTLILTAKALRLVKEHPLLSIRIPENSGYYTLITLQAKDRAHLGKCVRLLASAN